MKVGHLLTYIRTTEARVTAGTAALMIFRRLINSGVAFILAPALGATAYGVYSFAFSFLNIVGALCLLGFGLLAVREVAQFEATRETRALHGFLRFSTLFVVVVTFAVSVLIAVSLWRFGESIDEDERLAVVIACGILPFFVLTTLSQAVLTGLNHVLIAQIPETVIRPVIFGILSLGAVMVGFQLSGAIALCLFGIGAVFGFGFAAVALARRLPSNVFGSTPRYRLATWARGALFLWVISLIHSISAFGTPILLTLIAGSTLTGIFALCFAITNLIPFVYFAVERAFAPRLAALWVQGETEEIQKIIARMAWLSFLCATPVSLGIVYYGEALLGLFGSQFEAGETAVRILAIGQLISIGIGQPGVILVMAGQESVTTRALIVRTVITVALNVVLVPLLGLLGAAVAQSSGGVLSQLLLSRLVRRRVGFGTTILSLPWRTGEEIDRSPD